MLDALAATGLMSVALLGFSADSINLTRQAKLSDGTSAGTALAVQKLEQLRSLPLGATGLASGSYSDAGTLAADGTAGGPYTRAWTVSAKDSPRSGLKTVSVSVTWRDASQQHTTQMAAYVRCSTVPCP